VEIAPGVEIPVERDVIRSVSEAEAPDLGRFEVTRDPADRWKYRTPTLRNVALTAPYMHDGSLRTLREVIDFYDRGGEPHEGLDPLVHPLALTAREKNALVAFLESLTGDNVDKLTRDARSAPVGNPALPPGHEKPEAP
jgi:cytochrome c peroxidase